MLSVQAGGCSARFLWGLPSFRSGALFKEKCKEALPVEGKCRAKRQQPHRALWQGVLPTFPLCSSSQDHAAHSQAGHGHTQSFGGSVEDWQQRPIHNIVIFFPILAHRPQQEVLLLSNTYSKALHLFLPTTHLTWEHTLPLKVTEKIQIDGDMMVQESGLNPLSTFISKEKTLLNTIAAFQIRH